MRLPAAIKKMHLEWEGAFLFHGSVVLIMDKSRAIINVVADGRQIAGLKQDGRSHLQKSRNLRQRYDGQYMSEDRRLLRMPTRLNRGVKSDFETPTAVSSRFRLALIGPILIAISGSFFK